MGWFIAWLRLVFLTRYSIFIGLCGPVLIPLAAMAAPDLLGSFLVLDDPWQLFNITWLSFVLAIFVLVSFRLTQVNAPARFADLRTDFEELNRSLEEHELHVAHIVPRRAVATATTVAHASSSRPAARSASLPTASGKSTGDLAVTPRRRSSAAGLSDDVPQENVTLRIDRPPTPARLPPITRHGWRWRWVLLAVMGLTLPLICVCQTSRDLSPSWTRGGVSPGLLGAAAMLGGVAVAMLVLAAMLLIQQLLIDPEAISCDLLPFELWPWLMQLKQLKVARVNSWERRLARFVRLFGPGYTQKAPSGEVVMAPGHAQSALWMLLSLAVYFYSYRCILSSHHIPDGGSPMSVLFFLLMMLFFFHSLLTGLAFFLDYYRVPTLLGLVLLAVMSSSLFDTASVYQLNPPRRDVATGAELVADSEPPKADVELKGLLDDWKAPRRTLVVVSAAGGGIQAAAWTTKVLAGLDEIYGPDFTRSIGMVSGVSGGSVGTMYYMVSGDWTKDGAPFDKKAREEMVESAESSCLEATGWGFAYPDLMRTFLPVLVPRHIDRGWAIEQVWQSRIGRDVRLRDWITPIRKHQMPIPVFNATLAETGQRLVISPVVKKRLKRWPSSDSCDFFNLYPGDTANPRVTTAARLSATFPYVSPISRADADDRPGLATRCYHVADGAYAENEGLFTVVDWIQDLVSQYNNRPQDRPFDTILVIRVQPFSIKWKPDPARLSDGLAYDVLGPLETIQNARGASQAERNDFDLDLVTASARMQREKNPDAIQIVWTNFMFHPAKQYTPPMSWHLTESQKHEIAEAWADLTHNWGRTDRPQQSELSPIRNRRRELPLTTVDKFFPRAKAPRPAVSVAKESGEEGDLRK